VFHFQVKMLWVTSTTTNKERRWPRRETPRAVRALSVPWCRGSTTAQRRRRICRLRWSVTRHFEMFPSRICIRNRKWETLVKVTFYSILLWNNHLPIRFRHRQSGVQLIGYKLGPRPRAQACGWQPCPTLVCRLMVATLVIHVITWITTHLPTPEGWKAELALLVDP